MANRRFLLQEKYHHIVQSRGWLNPYRCFQFWTYVSLLFLLSRLCFSLPVPLLFCLSCFFFFILTYLNIIMHPQVKNSGGKIVPHSSRRWNLRLSLKSLCWTWMQHITFCILKGTFNRFLTETQISRKVNTISAHRIWTTLQIQPTWRYIRICSDLPSLSFPISPGSSYKIDPVLTTLHQAL